MAKNNDEKLIKRFEMIAPLLNDGIDKFERKRLRAQILESSGLSDRTLRHHIQMYKKIGYKSLAVMPRSDKGELRAISEDIIQKAIELKQELPSRSVRRIIEILEGEKLIKPGEVKRTSLSRHLNQRGYGAAQLKASKLKMQSAGRYQRKKRNSLWIADIKYGPVIAVDGKSTKTYLLAIIDDKTRMIMHAEFYDNQRLPILEDCFRKALLKYGKPVDFYVDNGKIFVSKWFRLACARFGIRHLTAPPQSAKSKGKIEKYNQRAGEFIREFGLETKKTIRELNRMFVIWMDEGYTHEPHDALTISELDPETGRIASEIKRTPYQAYIGDPAKVCYVSSLECRDAFLWEETRKVDNSGCIKLARLQYDVGTALIKKRVEIRYDPFDISVIEVWHDGKFQRKAERLQTPEFLQKNERKAETPSTKIMHSRLLKVYEEKNMTREKQRNGALDFRGSDGSK